MIINQIIFSEFSLRFRSLDEVEDALPPDEFRREGLPWSAAFAASRAFALYRRDGGRREMVLPDFLIGAHAAIRGYSLLTRDLRRFRTYFPTVDLITPETHP